VPIQATDLEEPGLQPRQRLDGGINLVIQLGGEAGTPILVVGLVVL
jgi:hypothetical protein